MSQNNGAEKPKIIKTQGESGEIYNFELIDVFEFESKEYGLLAYIDEESAESTEIENEDEEKEEEVVIMKLGRENDSYVFETIEDDEEFAKIVAYLETEYEEE